MCRAIKYNFEKFSIFDIKKYLEEWGFKTTLAYFRPVNRLLILETAISIDVPCDSGDAPLIHIDEAFEPELDEKSKALYQQLKTLFGLNNDAPEPKIIKDIEKIRNIDLLCGGK